MNTVHFQNQVTRLMDCYGNKAFPKERCQLLWNKVKDLPDEWMTRTVDNFIAYQDKPPLQGDWDERIQKEQNKAHEARKHTKLMEPTVRSGVSGCPTCKGDGIYFDDEYKGFTVCKCYRNPPSGWMKR